MKRFSILTLLPGVAILVIVGCTGNGPAGNGSDDAYNPTIDPADYVEAIDNPYRPPTPGTT